MLFYFVRIFIVSVFCFIAGCNNIPTESGIRLSLSADIRGFDPAHAVDVRSGKIISLVYDNLVRFGDSTELVPEIASRWDISSDGKKYQFTIRKNALFHDGSPVTAHDVVRSFERILNPKTLSPQNWMFTRIDGSLAFIEGSSQSVKGLVAKNDSSLIIKLNAPFSPFIQYLAMPSAAIINYRGVGSINEFPSGGGPWILTRWERGGKIQLIRNKNYWGEQPKESALIFRIIPEAMTRSAEFEAGNLDLLTIPSTEIQRWDEDPEYGHRIVHVDELNIWYIGLNCSVPPFNDVRVREAMNLSLDREKHLRLLVPGGELASGPVPPALLRFQSYEPLPYNPEKAIRLLEECGYPEGLETELWVGGGSEMFHVTEAFQSDWSAVGINVKIIQSDWNVFKTAVRNGHPPMYYLNWTADYPDAENFLYPLFYSTESMTKRNRYSNPVLDDIILQIQSLSYGTERSYLIQKANKILLDEVPWVFLWHRGNYNITQTTVSGYRHKLVFNAERFLSLEKKNG